MLVPADGIASIYPQNFNAPSPNYAAYIALRSKLLEVIRKDTTARNRIVDDIVDSLVENDRSLPTGLLAGVQYVLTLGKSVRDKRKKTEGFRKAVVALLEQVFDPVLEFKMTKKDILDALEANGVERDKVSPQQISQVYVKVLSKLRSGELRDLITEEQLLRYVNLKIEEITYSRMQWELNER